MRKRDVIASLFQQRWYFMEKQFIPVVVFEDGTDLSFDFGTKDSWCVYVHSKNGEHYAPLDKHYFQNLISAKKEFSAEVIYNDFCLIYDLTKDEWSLYNRQVDKNVFSAIHDMCKKYNNRALIMEKTFSILYMGMLAEYRYENTRLNKKVKKLGVHRVLIDGYSAEKAANEIRGKSWQYIDKLCTKCGINKFDYEE